MGDDYMLHMSLQANGMAGLFSPNYNKMDVDWSDKARQQERGFMFENLSLIHISLIPVVRNIVLQELQIIIATYDGPVPAKARHPDCDGLPG